MKLSKNFLYCEDARRDQTMGQGRNMAWVLVKKPITFKQGERAQLEKLVTNFVEKTAKLKDMLSRIVIKAGRVYVYKLFEPAPITSEGVTFTQPLIDGKYLEFPYLRITLYNRTYTDCTLDLQRYNKEWMVIHEGTLEECLVEAEESEWFD
jgi:hypothetical protein